MGDSPKGAIRFHWHDSAIRDCVLANRCEVVGAESSVQCQESTSGIGIARRWPDLRSLHRNHRRRALRYRIPRNRSFKRLRGMGHCWWSLFDNRCLRVASWICMGQYLARPYDRRFWMSLELWLECSGAEFRIDGRKWRLFPKGKLFIASALFYRYILGWNRNHG